VIAVVSKDIAPYKRALAGVARTLPGNPFLMLDQDEAAVLKRIKDRAPAAVIAIGVKAARAVHAMAPEMPVVYCLVLDPEGNDLVTPTTLGVPFEPSLRDEIEVLKRAVPAITKIGVVINPARPPPGLDEALGAAQKIGVTVAVEKAGDAAELHAAVTRLAPRIDGIAVLAEPSIVTRDTFKSVMDLAIRRRLPVVATTEEFAKLGALISLHMEFEEAGHAAALAAEQIAMGRKPSEVTLQKPSWQVVVNLATAEAIGVTVAPAVLETARVVR
jgi:putative tryptophan/tyrosine transport system substrate-binding protein